MPLLELTELPTVAGGTLHGALVGGEVRGIAIDSRRVQPGDLFFALGGRHTDGHRFVGAAFAQGAVGAVVTEREHSGPSLVVESPLAALHRLAAWHRRRAIGRVVAITGSNGKTIVKDALAALLATKFRVHASPGSYNSQIGVPLAVLGAPADTEIGVFEAGISAPGEMDALEAILRPDMGILVNVGLAHISGFGTREVTAREKLRLFRNIPASGWALLPQDPVVDPTLTCCVLRPAQTPPQVLVWKNTPTGTLLELDWSGVRHEVSIRTRSSPLVDDLLLAVAAASLLGVPPDKIASVLQDYSFGPTRMETWRTPDGVTLINDAASADPLSVQAALETVSATAESAGRRFFVFGGMREFGDREAQEHMLIGRLAAERGFTHLVLLPHAASAHTAAAWRAALPDGPVIEVAGVDSLQAALRPLVRSGDTLLVKGPKNDGLASAARHIWESMSARRLIIDLGAIRENMARFRALCGPSVQILAVLKAWAYGTELPRVAAALQAGGADWIGVSTADEGGILRRGDVRLPILVMLLDLEEVDKVIRYQLTPVVYSLPLIRSLAEAVRGTSNIMDVHLEIDTGMGRLGVSPADALPAARLVRAAAGLRLTGVMTHLSSADNVEADDYTDAQLKRFDTCVAAIRKESPDPLVVHAAATSGAVRFPKSRYDMVRIGLGLYGIYPSPAVAAAIELQAAVAFVSRLAQVATWPRGQRVGYNGTYIVEAQHLRVGVVEIGYNDGVPWRLSNHGEVLIQGRRTRVLGRVSMDSMVVDLSELPDATEGDEVLLFGARDGKELRPEEVATKAGTLVYELLVNVDSRRVQRVFVGE